MSFPEFLRCHRCSRITTEEYVCKEDGSGMECPKCHSRRYIHGTPSLLEEIVYLAKNPSKIKYAFKEPSNAKS